MTHDFRSKGVTFKLWIEMRLCHRQNSMDFLDFYMKIKLSFKRIWRLSNGLYLPSSLPAIACRIRNIQWFCQSSIWAEQLVGPILAHDQPKQWAICYFWWADTYFDSVHLYFNNFNVIICFYERSMRNSWTYCYMLNVISQKCDHDLASYFMKICLNSCWCQCQCSTHWNQIDSLGDLKLTLTLVNLFS